MKSLRYAVLLLGLSIAIPVVVDASIQQQRAQITVTITVNVTPAPIAYNGSAMETSRNGIKASLVLNAREALDQTFHAENLSFVGGSMIAQATNQKAVKVEAEVSPNPNGTLLTSDQTGVVINQQAGTTVSYPCIYHVSVSTAITNWSLDHGLYSNFIDMTDSTAFAGSAMKNKSYIATPQPAFTPFVVYSNGQNWALLQANSKSKTYCVDLELVLPASTSQGSYSSQATYTLLY